MRMNKLILIAIMILGMVFESQAQKKQRIGNKFGGGIVFSVTPDGLHGLIAETQDQGTCNWDEAHALIANPSNHSLPGRTFTDWRLPDKEEIGKLFRQRRFVGGFTNYYYWTSTENGKIISQIWNKTFTSGAEMTNAKCAIKYVRAIRAF